VSGVGPLWAHSPRPGGNRWHPLEDHLRGTAELAARFADPFGGGQIAYWLGLLHDAGKAACGWQDGLARAAGTHRPVGTDHKALGTRLARERGLGAYALGIWGHHGGLIDGTTMPGELKKRLRDNAANVASSETAIAALLPELADASPVELPPDWSDRLVREMAMRLVFSALCDADYLDTAAHFAGLSAPRVRSDADIGQLRDRFKKRRVELLAERPAAPADALRDEVYLACVAAAAKRPGVFRLAAPTGSGKTLASAGFALHHAAVHRMRRIVVAVPFLTITEQNAAVYRGLLDDVDTEPAVLEHHSGVDFDTGGGSGRWARLAAENWDAPFVVTTFVRLFESLFARKPAAMRRVHRLAGAVIILDEVQALPHHVLVPILDGLRLLVNHFGTTVVLSTATQPEFWALSPFHGLPAIDLVPEPRRAARDQPQVVYEWRLDPRPTLADIAESAAAERTAMVVVNTTADACTVYDRWRGQVPHGMAWHLSTRMCPDHRRRVLAQVRQRLAAGEPVLLVSTQLIEAGVDIDFPVVYRAMAPADSLLQAAGRANREGRLSQPGRVVIFAPADGKAPPAYRTLVGETNVHFGPAKADPDDLAALAAYYRSIYQGLNLADPNHIGQQIQEARRRWEFETVADGPMDTRTRFRDRSRAFRLITDAGISVVTPQGAAGDAERREIEDLVVKVRTSPVPAMADLRKLHPYTATLHPSVLRANAGAKALLEPILGTDIRAGALVEWRGRYDDATGIDIDPCIEEFVL
jgi:CRISPR-associated endonuclease/helicase Cas3